MYNSIDTIPAKLYFKILETGNISLLSKKNKSQKVLSNAWGNIEEEHNQIPSIQAHKTLNISKKVESLGAKYEFAKLAVFYMRARGSDAELISLLKQYNYHFTGNLNDDLDNIERESKAIKIIVNRLRKKLPEKKKEHGNTSFDEVILGYASLCGSGFIDTNKITLTQYYALINIGNQKIKALEDARER